MTDSSFQMDTTLIGDRDSIEARVADVTESEREAIRQVLGYLYLDDGPRSIAREHKTQAEQHLSPAELFVFQWLYKRTDGKLRRLYGPATLEAVKRSRYRCENCGFADVRALHLEKTDDDEDARRSRFACLCANCHTVESRAKEMAAFVSNTKEPTATKAKTEGADSE